MNPFNSPLPKKKRSRESPSSTSSPTALENGRNTTFSDIDHSTVATPQHPHNGSGLGAGEPPLSNNLPSNLGASSPSTIEANAHLAMHGAGSTMLSSDDGAWLSSAGGGGGSQQYQNSSRGNNNDNGEGAQKQKPQLSLSSPTTSSPPPPKKILKPSPLAEELEMRHLEQVKFKVRDRVAKKTLPQAPLDDSLTNHKQPTPGDDDEQQQSSLSAAAVGTGQQQQQRTTARKSLTISTSTLSLALSATPLTTPMDSPNIDGEANNSDNINSDDDNDEGGNDGAAGGGIGKLGAASGDDTHSAGGSQVGLNIDNDNTASLKDGGGRKRKMSIQEDILMGSDHGSVASLPDGDDDENENGKRASTGVKRPKIRNTSEAKMEDAQENKKVGVDSSSVVVANPAFPATSPTGSGATWSVRQNLGVKEPNYRWRGESLLIILLGTNVVQLRSSLRFTPRKLTSFVHLSYNFKHTNRTLSPAHQMADDYISLASSITLPPTYLGPFGYTPTTGQYPIEQVTALGYLTSSLRRPTVIEKWSPYEIVTFEAAMALHGKIFHQVQKWVKTKSTKEIVEFYYIWKKTSHYRRWKSQYEAEIEESSDEEEGGNSNGGGKGKGKGGATRLPVSSPARGRR
jgi:hypothetical protein